jgi:hypothetical protein
MKKLFIYLLIFFAVATHYNLIAQEPPHPPHPPQSGHGQQGNQSPGGTAPIGGGLTIMVLLSAFYGTFGSIRQKRVLAKSEK